MLEECQSVETEVCCSRKCKLCNGFPPTPHTSHLQYRLINFKIYVQIYDIFFSFIPASVIVSSYMHFYIRALSLGMYVKSKLGSACTSHQSDPSLCSLFLGYIRSIDIKNGQRRLISDNESAQSDLNCHWPNLGKDIFFLSLNKAHSVVILFCIAFDPCLIIMDGSCFTKDVIITT